MNREIILHTQLDICIFDLFQIHLKVILLNLRGLHHKSPLQLFFPFQIDWSKKNLFLKFQLGTELSVDTIDFQKKVTNTSRY
jgi:hypothetical protein